MRPVRFLLAACVLIVLMVLGSKMVMAQPQPNQYYGSGGGAIQGTVLGFDMYNRLEPIAWATVTADNGLRNFTTYSSGDGFYFMYVPTGAYNLTVTQPGYFAYSSAVAVSDGSTSTINVTLELSHVPVPEFQPNFTLMVMILTLGAALVIRRRSLKHAKQ